jgi:hypothetical protein
MHSIVLAKHCFSFSVTREFRHKSYRNVAGRVLMPSRPQHDWLRYLRFLSLFFLAHLATCAAFGCLSPGWFILSAGAFGLALGVPIGRAEYYTDGYEMMELLCPVFTCVLGLLLGAAAVFVLDGSYT